jgi:hypothetical protein
MALFIRAASIYLEGKKMATVSKSDSDTASNGTLIVGDSGVTLGWAKGTEQNTINVHFAVLFAGNTETQKLREALSLGSPVKIQNGIIDGKVESGEFFVESRKIESDHEKGTCNGSFTLKAGAMTAT